MDKEKLITVMEDDNWTITTWNFRDMWEARAFIYSHFEEVCNSQCNIDTFEEADSDDQEIDEEMDLISFHLDWYYLRLDSSLLYNKNPNENDWTKEFRGNTERSRQEDRTTPWDWWEA